MKSLNNLIITHGEDVDGLVSAGLTAVGRFLNAKKEEEDLFLKPIFVEYSNIMDGFEKALRITEKEEIANIFVCDLSAGDKLLEGRNSILRRLAKRVDSVFWFDHHIGTKKNLEKLQDAGIKKVFCRLEDEICTADIVSAFFGINEKKLTNLAFLARVHDCYSSVSNKKFYRIAESFQYAISAVCYFEKGEERENSLFEAFKCVMNADILSLSQWTHGKLGVYEGQIISSISRYYKSIILEEVDFSPAKIIFANASSMLPRKDTVRDIVEEYSVKNGALGVCVIFDFPSRDVCFFSMHKSKFNAADFCFSLGGGGRGGDGGFSLPEDMREKKYEEIVNFIKDALNIFLYPKKY